MKNVIVFIFGNHISEWHSLQGLFKTYFSHIAGHHGNDKKSFSASFSTYPTYTHTHILPALLTFMALPILQKLWIHHVWFLFNHVWFLFGMTNYCTDANLVKCRKLSLVENFNSKSD